MAKQRGIIKLEGTIGDITFFKSQDGYVARERSGPSAEQIASDPAFQRTRENGQEFGRAGKAGKVLRTAFRSLLQNASDSRSVSRLTRAMMKVVHADITNNRGERNVIDGETALLQGFDFNVNARLSTTMHAPFTANMDRVGGTLTLEIPPFVPSDMLVAPAGATHFKIVSAGSEVDFETAVTVTDSKETAVLPLDNTATEAMSLEHAVTANSTHPLFLVLGIQFFQEVNGTMYPLKNGAHNPLNLVAVEG